MLGITLILSFTTWNVGLNNYIETGIPLYSGLFTYTSISSFMETFMYIIAFSILFPWATFAERGSVNQVSLVNNSNRGLTESEAGYINSEKGIKGAAYATISEYSLIILFTLLGSSLLINSADLLSMYLSIELQSFAVYILAALYRNSESAAAAGLKYFLLGALSSALILLGSALIYYFTGSTNLENLFMLLSTLNIDLNSDIVSVASQDSTGIIFGIILIGVGFLFKVAAAPFHNWAPDVYNDTPTIVTTWLTIMPKISIFTFLLFIGSGLYTYSAPFVEGTILTVQAHTTWQNLFIICSLLSLIIGSLLGLAQNKIKRLFAYSTISHVGFLLLGLACIFSNYSYSATEAFIFYILQYTLTNLNLFFILLSLGYLLSNIKNISAINVYNRDKVNNYEINLISELKGVFKYYPVLCISFAICLYSLAGIPPLLGFFGKFSVLYTSLFNEFYLLSLIAILSSLVSAYVYLKVISTIFFYSSDSYVESSSNNNINLSSPMVLNNIHTFIIALATLYMVGFVFKPGLILDIVQLMSISLFI
jgi:NADH-ubiquinone oxidoreductase chain 2